MFEAFYWMFKTEGVKQQVLYLIRWTFILIAIYIAVMLLSLFNPLISVFPFLAAFSLFGIFLDYLPILLIAFLWFGYFWELTEQIINRGTDISAAKIYNGKIRTIYKIELPELSFKKFVWRGFSASIATLILAIPIIALIFTGVYSSNINIENVIFSGVMTYTPILLGIILVLFLFPALFWNYAAKNSVFAVLNIRKAVYIAGNYTGKYIWNIFLIIFLSIIIQGIFSTAEYLSATISINTTFAAVLKIFIAIAYFIAGIYQTLYNAYLMGTITPPTEG